MRSDALSHILKQFYFYIYYINFRTNRRLMHTITERCATFSAIAPYVFRFRSRARNSFCVTTTSIRLPFRVRLRRCIHTPLFAPSRSRAVAIATDDFCFLLRMPLITYDYCLSAIAIANETEISDQRNGPVFPKRTRFQHQTLNLSLM